MLGALIGHLLAVTPHLSFLAYFEILKWGSYCQLTGDKKGLSPMKIGTAFFFLIVQMKKHRDFSSQRFGPELISFYEGTSFDLVALTHSHADHTGTAPWIQKN